MWFYNCSAATYLTVKIIISDFISKISDYLWPSFLFFLHFYYFLTSHQVIHSAVSQTSCLALLSTLPLVIYLCHCHVLYLVMLVHLPRCLIATNDQPIRPTHFLQYSLPAIILFGLCGFTDTGCPRILLRGQYESELMSYHRRCSQGRRILKKR